jgi:hypothetical protein
MVGIVSLQGFWFLFRLVSLDNIISGDCVLTLLDRDTKKEDARFQEWLVRSIMPSVGLFYWKVGTGNRVKAE